MAAAATTPKDGRSLPFGLQRTPACSPSRCLQPDEPLPLGTPLADQVAHALSALFSTFYATSLRYLGVSEILDWLEMSATVDAFILTGLEQGRLPAEIACSKNLEVGRGAFRSVIKGALEQDDEAWATSLREVGFSSGLSMAYEGIISQLKQSKSSPLPCLHTVITPSGLAMLKSAPLKHAFPICPPRAPPSPQALIASIRSLIAAGALSGPAWSKPSVWRPHIRRAFTAYHSLVKEVAEDVICEPNFSHEYNVFLQSISQPIQLLQLISEDFEAEFGPGACKGLLGVGEVGGQNLLQIMDFCAARRPSELLARVKARVAEKQAKEKAKAALDDKKWSIQRHKQHEEMFDDMIEELSNRDNTAEEDWAAEHRLKKIAIFEKLRQEKIEERAALQKEVDEEEARDAEIEREKERTKAERKAAAEAARQQRQRENEEAARQGSSKDLLGVLAAVDPFSASAPRAVSPATPNSAKGKARAPASSIPNRAPPRYGPARHPLPLSLRPASPAKSASTSRTSSPIAKRTLQPPMYTPPPSPPRPSAKLGKSISSRVASPGANDESVLEVEHESDGEMCCAMCADERREEKDRQVEEDAQQADKANDVLELEVEEQMPELEAVGQPENGTAAKQQKKKKRKAKSKKKDSTTNGGANGSKVDGSHLIPTILPAGGQDIAPLSVTADRFLTPVKKDALRGARPSQTFMPLSNLSPPMCCPPDRCTGDKPNHLVWPQLDGLLYETFVASFKYELIYHLVLPLEYIRNQLARQYLVMGGRMTTDDGEPKDMDPFMRLASAGMWSGILTPEAQHYCQRVLAVSMVKLVQLFNSTLGDVCICRLSNSPEAIANAHHRLTQCEMADRQIPVQLAPMDEQAFMKWAHGELRAKKLGGPEWQGVDRQYRVQDFLLAFTDAFDAAIDRMILDDPYVIAADFITLLEWQGGVRTFDEAMRLCHAGVGEVGDMAAAQVGTAESRPLASWGKVLGLGALAPADEIALDQAVAESQKKMGNEFYMKQDWQRAICCFAAASIIYPLEPTYYINAAAARLKTRTTSQYREAIADCTIALSLDDKCVKALYRRATALAAIFRWKDAVKDFRRLAELCPDDESCRDALEWAQDMAARSKDSKAKMLSSL